MINYDITPEERKNYVAARGKTVVTACPGSGKTTSIVYKLRELCSEVENSNKHSGVLCLSFTNKAVNEIKSAFKLQHGFDIMYPHEVTTIDSFLTQNIVLPYWYLFNKNNVSPIIVNEESLLHNMFWYHYSAGGKESEACHIREFGDIPHTYPPEKINYCAGKYYFKTTELRPDYYEYANRVFEFRLTNGFLTSSDAIYVALKIIEKNPIIAKSIVGRYPYLIVDEAQDTSLDQYLLIGELLKAGLQNIEFVGDINQSIYEWRFARPDLLEKLTQKEGWRHIPFVNNRRSVQRIIDFYSKLVPANRFQSIVSTDVLDQNIPIVVYKYDKTNSNNVINDFEKRCKDNCLKEWLILTRGHSLGKILSGSKEKPDYWKSPIPKMLLNAYEDFQKGLISEAVQQLAFVWSTLVFKEKEYKEKRQFIKNAIDNYEVSTHLINVLIKMPGLSETFQSWTNKMPQFLKNEFSLDKLPTFDVYSRKNDFDIKLMSRKQLSDYFGNEINKVNTGRTILTIHASKGASTDAVLLFLSANNQGKQLSLNLFESIDKMTEKHRMLYVACSRARQFLALAVPTEYPDSKIRKLMNGFNYELKSPGLTGELF